MALIKAYQPQYYKKFSCIGSRCRHNCCQGWQVLIDKGTYDKYASLDKEHGDTILEKIKLHSEDPFKAWTLLREDEVCAFQDEMGLCAIQRKYGHELLSSTCGDFPRKVNVVGGQPERFLEMSCEEVVSLSLFSQDYMNFEEIDVDDSFVSFRRIMDTEEYTDAENGLHIFWKLRVASVAIMQTRKYKVRLRMLILCLFIQEADNLLKEGRASNVDFLANDYMRRLDTDFYDDLARQMPNGAISEPDVIFDILKSMALNSRRTFAKILKQSLDALGLTLLETALPDGWSENYLEYYRRYLADKEYVFENYIVNCILSEGFPFNYKREIGMMENYAKLLAKYNILEFLLVGQCRSQLKFNKRDIIECIVVFTRCYDHNYKGYLQSE